MNAARQIIASPIFWTALALATGAVATNAPDGLPYLWEIKTLTVIFTGWAGLALHPPGSGGAAPPQ